MKQDLFSEIQLGELALSNRIVMAPMTRNRAPNGIPTALMGEYYAQRATAGLIITEGAQISPQGVGYPATPGIYNDEQVSAWQQVIDDIHTAGGAVFVQLWHCGRISHPSFHDGALPVAPSAVQPAGQAVTYAGMQDFVTPRALAIEELANIVEQYRHAAEMAIKAGFDGVEIHSANGYLLDQFLRDGSNRRTDSYGGSIEHRVRLLIEVTTAVCNAIGANKVGVRISPVNAFNDMQDSDPQALFNHVASALSALSPAYLHVVEVTMAGAIDTEVDMAQLRHHFDGRYIANGGYDRARGNSVIATEAADMVAYGVPFLANPDLPNRLKQETKLNTPDQATFYGGDAHGYTDYPFA
ncbi:MAG: alkene reductase [Mariprofundales bacterium]|nr:alkene reductase [Mariprofundales bacterium]